jgi:uncharacterized protein YcsI (UPF0317 family)
VSNRPAAEALEKIAALRLAAAASGHCPVHHGDPRAHLPRAMIVGFTSCVRQQPRFGVETRILERWSPPVFQAGGTAPNAAIPKVEGTRRVPVTGEAGTGPEGTTCGQRSAGRRARLLPPEEPSCWRASD